MARSEGFEPPTFGVEIRNSIQLSYERKMAEGSVIETHSCLGTFCLANKCEPCSLYLPMLATLMGNDPI